MIYLGKVGENMKVISNGVEKDVDVYKHFKIANDEYVLYKNTGSISVALINGNTLVAPAPDKLDVLMKVLGNLVSPTVNESLLFANDCTLMSDIMETTMQEVSYQNVNITQEQLNNLTGAINTPAATPAPSPASETQTAEAPKEKKPQNNKMKIYAIVIVVLALILCYLLFKDKLFSKSSGGGGSPTPAPVVTDTPSPSSQGIASCSNCVYAYYEDYKHFLGDKTILTDYANDYQNLQDVSGNVRLKFLGHVLDGEGKIEKSFACGVENSQAFCLEGAPDSSKYENNKALLQSIFGEGMCTESEVGFLCQGSIKADAYLDGNVKVSGDDYECQVYNNGDSACIAITNS